MPLNFARVKKILRKERVTIGNLLYFLPLKHEVENPDCWCRPEIMQPCPESADEPGQDCAEGCYRCSGRNMVPEYEPDQPACIIHRDV